MVRKIAAASGLANRVRKACSNSSPVIPTGIVPMMSSQASRSSASRATMRRAAKEGRTVRAKPADDADPVGRKKMIRASAVATCNATMNARYGLVSLAELRGLGDEVLPAAAQKGRDEHGVTEAGDREQSR